MILNIFCPTYGFLASIFLVMSDTGQVVEAAAPPSSTNGTVKPLIIQASNNICGYIEGAEGKQMIILSEPRYSMACQRLADACSSPKIKVAPYGCPNTKDTCAVYFPSSSLARALPGESIKTSKASSLESTGVTRPPTAHESEQHGPQPRSESPPMITPPPSNDGSIICCGEDSDYCTIQPTTCVDNYNHPASDLCKDDCLHDPMTLKCTNNANLHCNQVNLESPLVYVDSVEGQWKARKRRIQKSDDLVTATGVVRGWFCGLSTVPKDIFSTVTEVSTVGPGGALHTKQSVTSDASTNNQSRPESTTQTAALGPGPAGLPFTNTQDVEFAPTDPGDCDLDVVDCCVEDDDVALEEPCIEECAEIVPRTKVPHQKRRRRSISQPASTSEVEDTGYFDKENGNVITNVITITQGERPIGTAVPAPAPGMTITEAILIVSTTYANQSNRSPLSEVTRALTIVPPTGTSISSTARPKTSGGPRGGVQKIGKNSGNPKAGIIAGGVVGGLVLAAVMIWLLLWCFRRYRREKRAKRIRKQRDSNPVSSRITTSWSF